MRDVVLALSTRFPGAEITESITRAEWNGEEVHWVRVDAAAPGRTFFIGVARGALDHPQNLLQQLDDYLYVVDLTSSATLVLTDRSGISRYRPHDVAPDRRASKHHTPEAAV